MPETDIQAAPRTLFTESVRKLRVLSYNVQVGIRTSNYRDYITGSWKHVLPHPERWTNMDQIADRVRDFDIVALQELDGGSLRTGFVNQTRYLAQQGQFPRWHQQTNRRVGLLTKHCNAMLCRVDTRDCSAHRLPGSGGRGALLATIGDGDEQLAVVIAHLSLGKRNRLQQIEYLAELVNGFSHCILMGDFNCEPTSTEISRLLDRTDLHHPTKDLHTFPSWRPKRRIDHVLVTPSVSVERSYAPQWRYSDHLPIAVDVQIPSGVKIYRAPLPMAVPQLRPAEATS
ncbi:MAG: endonuclease/exonuclease/phosphatase family protein [Gammaproteobacteria bacterium]|nr:endonuclease/exonuclease/phosphatase family protein [Gammaproteobacteria bacterium]